MLASAACAAAQSAGELIAARAAQGLLGAIMLPQAFGLIRDMFAHEMGKAFGVYGPVMGLSAMLGPIAAGGLISANVFGTGWRIDLPGERARRAGRAGAGRADAARGRELPARAGWTCRARCWPRGHVPARLPARAGSALGWPAWLFGMLAASVLMLAGFGWYQVRRQRAGRDPLVEPSVFRHRSYGAASCSPSCSPARSAAS